MGEVIVEAIVYLFVEIIFQGIILGIFKMIRAIGIMIIKIVTFDKASFSEISVRYSGSVIPYFAGFSVVIAVIYALIKFY